MSEEDWDDDWGDEQPKQKVKLAPIEGVKVTGPIEVLSVPEIATRFEGDGDGQINLETVLKNRLGQSVELTSLYLKFRDSEGRLLAAQDSYLSVKFKSVQEVNSDVHFPAGVIEAASSVELVADYMMKHRTRVGTGHFDSVPTPARGRQRIPMNFVRAPEEEGHPRYDVKLDCYLGERWGDPHFWVVAEIREQHPSKYYSLELMVSVRDENDDAVVREKFYLECPQDGSAAWTSYEINVNRSQVARMRTVRVVLAGETTRRELLGRYTIVR